MFPTLKKHDDNFLKEATMGNFASEEDAKGNIFVDRGQTMNDKCLFSYRWKHFNFEWVFKFQMTIISILL